MVVTPGGIWVVGEAHFGWTTSPVTTTVTTNPASITFPSPGTYTITVIANSKTTSKIVTVSPPGASLTVGAVSLAGVADLTAVATADWWVFNNPVVKKGTSIIACDNVKTNSMQGMDGRSTTISGTNYNGNVCSYGKNETINFYIPGKQTAQTFTLVCGQWKMSYNITATLNGTTAIAATTVPPTVYPISVAGSSSVSYQVITFNFVAASTADNLIVKITTSSTETDQFKLLSAALK